MSEGWVCVAGLLITSVTAIWIVLLCRGAVKSVYFHGGWKDVFRAWRDANTLALKGLVFVLILVRGGYWAFAGVAITAVGSVAASGCGFQLPAVLSQIKEIFRDYYEFRRSAPSAIILQYQATIAVFAARTN